MSLQKSKYICLDDTTTKKFVIDNEQKLKIKEKYNENIEQVKYDEALKNMS